VGNISFPSFSLVIGRSCLEPRSNLSKI
jgi:hypothetical protein